MSKYIIIDAEAIQKRIEEITIEKRSIFNQLKELYDALKGSDKYYSYKDNISRYLTALTNEKRLYERIQSQSTPLIPELEKAYIQGCLDFQMNGKEFTNGDEKDYISNLKLDI